jgi:hypothetical protein
VLCAAESKESSAELVKPDIDMVPSEKKCGGPCTILKLTYRAEQRKRAANTATVNLIVKLGLGLKDVSRRHIAASLDVSTKTDREEWTIR